MVPTLTKGADGSLTLYIQNKSPGADKEAILAACAERPDLPGDAALRAEGHAAFDPPGRPRHLAAARHQAIATVARRW